MCYRYTGGLQFWLVVPKCVCVCVSVIQEDGKKSFGFNLRRSGHLNKAKEIMD